MLFYVDLHMPLEFRPRLFKSWIALYAREITIQQISIWETNCIIQWIEIYPSDGAIHLFNNWGLHTVYVLDLMPTKGLFTWRWGPLIGEVTSSGSPHLSCKLDQMDRRVTSPPPKRVTSPPWGPRPPCKQALMPSDFFLTPGRKNSATRINIPEVN